MSRHGIIGIGSVGLCLLFACAAVSADQMYKWVDSDGHVHYSQTPPPGTAVKPQAVAVRKPQQYATDPQTTEQNQQVARQAAAQAQEDAQTAKQAAEKKAAQQQYCDNLKARLQLLEQVNGVFSVDANGERHYESDADHEKAEQQLKDELASQCSGS